MPIPGLHSGGSGSSYIGRDKGHFGLAVETTITGDFPSGTEGVFSDPEVTWTADNSHQHVGQFVKGANWQKYKTAVLAMGATPTDIVEDATTIYFRNTALVPFLSLFDIVYANCFTSPNWPGITPKFIKSVKDMAAASKRKRRPGLAERPPHFVFQGWKDDLPTGELWSSQWNHYYNGFRDANMFMLGTGPNGYGCNHVDADEANPWPGGPYCLPGGEPRPASGDHNWFLDYTKTGFAETAARLARQQWDTYFNASSDGEPIDAFRVEDILPFFNPRGTATNRPTFDPAFWESKADGIFGAYQAAFKDHPTAQYLWNSIGRLTGPGGDPTDPVRHLMPSAKNCYYNYQFSSALAWNYVIEDCEIAARNRRILSLGNEIIHSSFLPMFDDNDHPDWWKIMASMRAFDWEENVYISMASVNTGARLFWHPAMRDITY